jgi:5-dehydro-2-deoxygluconokinase
MSGSATEQRPIDRDRSVDLVAMGRVAVDLYSEQIGTPLRDAQTFRKYLGGCAGNVAVGAARLGLSVRILSRVGRDEMGAFLRESLEREGVNTDLLADDPERLSGLVLLGVAPPDRFPLLFYRENCADMWTRLDTANAAWLGDTRALMVTGTGMSRPESAEATLAAARAARAAGTAVVVDVDFRPVLWNLTERGDGESRFRESARVTSELARLLPLADLVVGTEEELAIAGGSEDPKVALARVRALTAATVVVKRGAAGAVVHANGGAPIDVAGRPVEILNVLGAGDAFLAGFLRGWLRGEPLATCASWGNGSGALVVARHGCAPAMPTFEELSWFLAAADARAAAASDELARRHRVAGRPPDEDLLVLAFDHRTFFEKEAKERGLALEAIAEFKWTVFEGFRAAREREPGVGLALLVDPIYGGEILRRTVGAGFRVGSPIERAGSFPVEWIHSGPLYAQILERPPSRFVKVLAHLHPQLEQSVFAAQLARLAELSDVCARLERQLMIEVIAPPGSEFAMGELASVVAAGVEDGLDPDWWKLPDAGAEEWDLLTRCLDEAGSRARFVPLGGGRPASELAAGFAAARATGRSAGFAIGRSVFGPAWRRFLDGERSPELAADVARRLLELVDAWRAAGR